MKPSEHAAGLEKNLTLLDQLIDGLNEEKALAKPARLWADGSERVLTMLMQAKRILETSWEKVA
jgi:hypothetical protein